MSRRRQINIKAVRRKEPDVRLYVLALIELARQLQAEEDSQGEAASKPRLEEDDDA